MRTLTGHVSAETAYVVEDYPYGFRLRCQMRHWIEYKKGQGFRHVSQTSNPKASGLVWNKPKASTYSTCLVLVQTDDEHIHSSGLHMYSTEPEIEAFAEQHADALTPTHRAAIAYLIAVARASKRITYRIVSAEESTQTPREQAAIFNAVITDEYLKAKTAAA